MKHTYWGPVPSRLRPTIAGRIARAAERGFRLGSLMAVIGLLLPFVGLLDFESAIGAYLFLGGIFMTLAGTALMGLSYAVTWCLVL